MSNYRFPFSSLLGFVLLFIISSGAFAQSTTHQVKAGDTLFGVAEQYDVSVQQIRSWNNLSSDQLSIGQELVIRKENSADESGITHTVEPKETLFSISKKYNVTIDEIKSWNDLQGQSLAIGSTLKIYPEQSVQSSASSSNNGSSGSYYTVKSGDSLFRIASQYNMSVDQLKRLNNLSSNNIQVGQRLTVQPTDRPPSLAASGVASSAQGKFMRYEVEQSRSREELLEKFQMDESEFRALNPGLTDASFRRGDNVNILAPPTRTFKNPYTTDSGLSTLGSSSASLYDMDTAEPTTSGELYNPDALTAGHANIAMGSVIFLQNENSGRGVFVRINDRISNDGLKLSAAAWKALGLADNGSTVTMFRNNE